MNTNDIKNYMQQMKRRNVLQKNNKEKQMQAEIMCLKRENERLKHDCEMHRDASIDC
jgi:cell shape-determining protein MreC